MTTTVFGDRKKSEHTSKKSDPVKKATSRKKSDIHLKNDQKSEKKQNDEFSHEKSKTGRFIYGPLFLPGALGGAFYPIYGTNYGKNCLEFFLQPQHVLPRVKVGQVKPNQTCNSEWSTLQVWRALVS